MKGRWIVMPETAHPLLAEFGIPRLWWTFDGEGKRQHEHVSLGEAVDCARRQIEIRAMEAALHAVVGDPR